MTPADPTMPAPPLVLVSWNGVAPALPCLEWDALPAFELVLLDYSGRSQPGASMHCGHPATLLSQATQCKGDIFNVLAQHLAARAGTPEYVGLIDDDVLLSVARINRMLHIARVLGLDAFSAALTHDSAVSHRWTLHRPNLLRHEVDWVEVMMPFYRGSLFMAAAPDFEGNVSSWGLDRYVLPAWQQILGLTRSAVIDEVTASHLRPITSDQRRFRNGLTAREEEALMHERASARLRRERPELIDSPWFRRLFVDKRMVSRSARLRTSIGRRLRRWLDASS